MVGFALMGLLAMVFSQLVVQTTKTQESVRTKSSVQDIKAMLQSALYESDACSAALGFSSRGAVPLPSLSPNSPSTSIDLIKFRIAGIQLDPGVSRYGQLQVVRVFIQPGNPIVQGSDSYLGSLGITLRDNSNFSFTRSVPLLFSTRMNNQNQREIFGCQNFEQVREPQQVCADLGGRWLSGQYMVATNGSPSPRCHLGRDIVLARNEAYSESAPGAGDGVPLMGGSNTIGERVTTCYRQLTSSARISPYQCSSRSGNRAGERCAYDTTARLWGIHRFGSTGVMGTRIASCEKGVEITTRPSDSLILEAHEDVSVAYEGINGQDGQAFIPAGAPSFSIAREFTLMEHRMGATRCKTQPDQDSWTACTNLSNPASGLEGQVNSCVFVRNVRLSSDYQGLINRHNSLNCAAGGDCALNRSSYTGWIRVRSPRKVTTTGIQEATGQPCFQVDYNPNVTPQPYREILSASAVAENNAALQNPSSIARCNLRRNKVHPSPMPSGSLSHNFQAFQCNNSEIDTSSVDTFTGNSSDDKPSINKGSCWYVKGIRLTNNGPAHTGWVYIQEDIPPNRYQADNHSQGDYALKYKGSARTLKALACDEGVSLQNEGL